MPDFIVTEHELEGAGWRYVGDGNGYVHVDEIRLWHDDAHQLPWTVCDHELCRRIRHLIGDP